METPTGPLASPSSTACTGTFTTKCGSLCRPTASHGATLAVGLRAAILASLATELMPIVDGPAVLVIDSAGEVAQASVGAAARMADLGAGPLGQAALPQGLRVLGGAARQFAIGSYPRVPRMRLRTRSGQWVVAHASPLLSRAGTSTDVVLTVEEARPPEIVPLVVAAFGLTRHEQDVVALVLPRRRHR